MEYRRSKYVGDINIDEVFEGDPKEILEVLNSIESSLKEDKSFEILQNLGIPIMDRKGRLRNMEDIMNDLSYVFSKEELIYDQEEAMNYIRKNLREDHEAEITEGLLRAILELEEEYMRNIGIIED